MKLNRSVIELPLTVSRDNVVSAILVSLQAFRGIPQDHNIIDIKFGDMTTDPLELTLILKEEVDTITLDGTQLQKGK